MKNSITTLLLFWTFTTQAQQVAFFADKWKVLSHVQKYKSREMSLYHRDSSNNLLDYAHYSIKFAPDFSYTGTNDRGTSIKGTWAISKTKDTMSIDRYQYSLQALNANYMTLRTFSREIVDTLGTLDTIYTDMTFYSLPDLTTSHLDGTFESEHIRVYPNPAKHKVEVQISGSQRESIEKIALASLTGQVIKTLIWDTKDQAQSLDVHDLQSGIYVLEILRQDGSRVAVRKIVKE